MDLSHETLQRLSQIEDPLGVLTVLVDASPDQKAQKNRSIGAGIRRELQALVEDARRSGNGSGEREAALRDRVAAIEGDGTLFDLTGRGRARVAIAPLSSDQVLRLDLQVPLPDGVYLGQRPHVAPLIAALDRGAPTGIAIVSKDGMKLLDRRLGEIALVREEPYVDLWDDMGNETGHPVGGGGAASPGKSIPQDDEYRRALDEDRVRFLRHQVTSIAREADERGWEWLVLAGETKLTAAVKDTLPASGRRTLLCLDRNLWSRSPAEIERSVAPELEEARRRRQLELVEQARDGALATHGRGALGLRDVVAALQQGNVANLLVDTSSSHHGFITEDGLIATPDEVGEEVAPWGLTAEPDLDERLIEQALGISAVVTPIDGPAATVLAEVGEGIAAILRWTDVPAPGADPTASHKS
jgi:hypothetical protein